MAEDADQAAGKAADPVLAGIDRLRETAKWLIGAYAAIGTVLVAGLQLTSLGKVEDNVRLGVAIAVAAIALFAVMYGIAKIASVLAPVQVEPSDLAPNSAVGQMVTATPTLLKGQAPDLPTLQSEYQNALDDYQDKRSAARDDPAKEPDAEQAYQQVMALHSPLEHLRKLALFQKVQKQYDDAKGALGVVTGIAAVCVIVFAWAANPSDADQAEAKAKESGPTLLNPSPATLSIEKERKSLAGLRKKLGKECKLDQVSALVVGGSAEEPDVITLPARGCTALRFTVSDDIGVALAAKSAVVPKNP